MIKIRDIDTTVLQFINKICPEHTRSSCSDDDYCITNWLYSRDEIWHGRCGRCVLLELAAWEEMPEWLKEDGAHLWRLGG